MGCLRDISYRSRSWWNTY